MQTLLILVEQYGLWLVFGAVIVEQLGAPIPAYPVLIVAGAVSARADHLPVHVIAVAVAACLIADLMWYLAGARIGRRMLRLLCRISLSPDSCVRQTESIYARWGAPSLAIAKFIPGFAAVATSMAGIVRTRPAVFVLFDGIGALLWAGLAVAIGWIFRDAVNDVLDVLGAAGRWGLVALAVALGLYISVKWVQRRRLLQQLRMARISVEELNEMLALNRPPLIVDVRAPSGRRDGNIPGALWIDSHAFDESLKRLPRADEVIVYCACPNEASAAAVAKRLIQHGFTRVRPLAGGIDAWRAAGYPIQQDAVEMPG
ncbi:MAG: rhodanese-like domain-containing protein [Betaproteobacteria bacterium]